MKVEANRDPLRRLERFFRDYTAGLNTRDLRRLFEQDAPRAYAVLTREHEEGPEPKGGFARFFYRAKLAFLGVSYKLSPARRFLFAISLFCFGIGFFGDSHIDTVKGTTRYIVDFSPMYFTLSFTLMAFLLSLELVERVRVRDELEVARQLQSDLLPRDCPWVLGYTFAHSYRTANEIGGDYYDFTPLPDGRLALTIGDASGHGMAAGLVMAIANATLETALDLDPTPERVVALLNRTLCRTGTRRTFMSLFYAVLDPATGRLDYTCAGHPFPLLRRAGGSIEELGCGGFPLGIREGVEPICRTTTLEPGDLLVLYTDGLAEAVDPARGEAFGFDRLQVLVEAGGSSQSMHDWILGSFDRHAAGEPLKDDLTLVIVQRLPFAVPPPPAT